VYVDASSFDPDYWNDADYVHSTASLSRIRP